MQRKWMLLPAMTLAVTALVAGLSMADDEDSPLHKKMEEVNKANLAIKKAVRTAVAYKKAQASNEIVKHADELVRLGKEARGLGKDAIKKGQDRQGPGQALGRADGRLHPPGRGILGVCGQAQHDPGKGEVGL